MKTVTVEMSKFSHTIMEQKYSHVKADGNKEDWNNIAYRVSKNVLKSVHAPKEQIQRTHEIIRDRKFIPGGRYLYATGRHYHQVNNCFLFRAEDSREGWADLLSKATLSLMSGGGIGIDYSDVRGEGKLIRKTGGTSTGPIALMQMVNESGRYIMQGGSRRSAIWAGLNWSHPDIQKFITLKNWSPEVRALKAADYNFPATMDGTNISVLLDDDFFEAYEDEKNPLNAQAQSVYWTTVRQMLKTGEPGFSIDTGKNGRETLRNACVPGDTELLTPNGYLAIETLIGEEVQIWNGFEWSKVIPKVTGKNQPLIMVQLNSGQSLTCTPDHVFWIITDYYGSKKKVPAKDLIPGMKLIKNDFPILKHGKEVSYAYTQGFISAEGMDNYNFFDVYDNKKNCISRMHLKTIGKNVNKRRRVVPSFDKFPKSFIPFSWDQQSRLNWLAGLLDGDGTQLIEGGVQIGSVDRPFLLGVQKMLTTLGTCSKVTLGQASCLRVMPDGKGGQKEYLCQNFYRLMIGALEITKLVDQGLRCSRLKIKGYKPNRSAARFVAVTDVVEAGTAETVYCFNEPLRHLGCFDGVVTGQCTEVSSEDDSDVCNLGSINMARISSLEEMSEVVELAVSFLLAGTVYSDVPFAQIDKIRSKNRRLGLGLMGLHEWLLIHGKQYGPDDELGEYLKIYATSGQKVKPYAKKWELSNPIKTRAVAPVGTIGIIGETTTGIEPIFCTAYKRRYLKGSVWNYQYVVDPTAKRLVDAGVQADKIEDAYTLAEDVERRLAFQAWVQTFVDHSISSTINLPAWGSELNNDNKVRDFGNILIKYLPKLRGVTVYPDGARAGQPINPIKLSTALEHEGEIFQEAGDVCEITRGGECGA